LREEKRERRASHIVSKSETLRWKEIKELSNKHRRLERGSERKKKETEEKNRIVLIKEDE